MVICAVVVTDNVLQYRLWQVGPVCSRKAGRLACLLASILAALPDAFKYICPGLLSVVAALFSDIMLLVCFSGPVVD